MLQHPSRLAAIALTVAAASVTAQAQIIDWSTLTTTQVPADYVVGTIENREATAVRGLNDRGEYVGTFGERNWTIWGLTHGYIHAAAADLPVGVGVDQQRWGPDGFRLGEIRGAVRAPTVGQIQRFHYLDLRPEPYPSDFNAGVTTPNAINTSGLVVGRLSADWLDRGNSTAFAYDSRTGSLQLLNVPGSVSSEANDVNASGQILGNYTDDKGLTHGFLFSGGVYTVIDQPGQVGRTFVSGLNDAGTVVGRAWDLGVASSFIWRNGIFEEFTANGLYTVASDINNSEQIVGWTSPSGQNKAFLYQGGNSVVFDLSSDGRGDTHAFTINNNGTIGGASNGMGFLVSVSAVPEPQIWALWLAGASLLAFRSGFSLASKAASRRPVVAARPIAAAPSSC